MVTLCVRGLKKMYPRCRWLLFAFVGSKKYTRNNVGCYLRLRVQKKCTRDVSEVATVFMGSKKCTREGVCCSLCLRVQKKCTRNNVGCFSSRRVQKIYPRRCLLLFVSVGSKKCTRDVVGYSLRSWVQKNVPADRAEWLCVKCCHALLLAT